MSQHDHPLAGPDRAPVRPRGASQMHWVSAFAGFAVGLVLATFAWVSVLPAGGGGDAGELLRVSPDELSEVGGDQGTGDGEQGPGGPRTRTRVIEEGTEGTGGGAGSGAVGVAGGVEGGAEGGGTGPGGGGGTAPGAGGGGTTTGVGDSVIRLGATVAQSGIAEAFLGEVEFGMSAVANRVNAEGGVHGRQLDVITRDDGWEPTTGRRFIENFIVEQKVFALAVSPSSEGLNAASNAGLFEQHGVPVVGADGLNNTQFLDPWIWPVASATTTQVHILLKQAADRAKQAGTTLRPAIVFGNTYRFGREGAFAFNGAYCRVTGGTFGADGRCNGGQNIPGFTPTGTSCEEGSRYCGISQASNGNISTMNSACDNEGVGGGRCNFMLLLLEPATALDWMSGPAKQPSDLALGMAGAQPLFTESFARECGGDCNKMSLWTGYNPPLGRYGDREEVRRYVSELDSASGGRADEFNQFTLGGYIGMTLLVEALDQVGPDLTRERLVQTLNSMPPLETGLTNDDGLRWTAEERYANRWAQSFSIDFRDGQFNSFVPETDYVPDPWRGQDNRPPS